MKWFREWREWVAYRNAQREEQLAVRLRQMVDSMGAPQSPYNVYDIINVVRRHDGRQ